MNPTTTAGKKRKTSDKTEASLRTSKTASYPPKGPQVVDGRDLTPKPTRLMWVKVRLG